MNKMKLKLAVKWHNLTLFVIVLSCNPYSFKDIINSHKDILNTHV